MHKATIIYNAHSRHAPKLDRLTRAADAYAEQGWQVEIVHTEASQHGTALAREAADTGSEVVISCGGDGTVNEVVNGLAGTQTALGLIRAGMGNVFAKEIGVSRGVEDALKVLIEGNRRRFDLGRANGRYFLCMAGVGFDAAIVSSVPDELKKRLGSTSYAVVGALDALRYRTRPVQVTIEGMPRETALYWLLLGNTRSYGGVLDVSSTAKVDDGLLDAYLFEGKGLPWIASTALRLATRRHENARGVTFQRIHTLEVTTEGLPVQLDGEYVGETPMTFESHPSAVDVLLPSSKGNKLFSE